jgi:hypothetical protein
VLGLVLGCIAKYYAEETVYVQARESTYSAGGVSDIRRPDGHVTQGVIIRCEGWQAHPHSCQEILSHSVG